MRSRVKLYGMCTHAGRSSILAIDLSTLHTLSKLRLCHRTETSLALATPSQLSTKVPRLLSLSSCTDTSFSLLRASLASWLSYQRGPCQRPGEERISSSPSPKSATKCFSRSSISPSASSCASPSLSTMAATAPAEWERGVHGGVTGTGREEPALWWEGRVWVAGGEQGRR